ncbi:MAG: Flp family type IVb pilin [Anaerolineaceae bacterium]|nr:MAG: Flp family type IVb pilin [Anaerolineaceae bacterium]
MLHSHMEEGQGLVEYALILVLIAVVVIIALTFLGDTIDSIFNTIGNTLNAVPNT